MLWGFLAKHRVYQFFPAQGEEFNFQPGFESIDMENEHSQRAIGYEPVEEYV